MAKVGDKFIIEIGAVQKHYGVNFIKGINHLVMSDEDLDKLEKYEPGKELEDDIKVGDEVAEDGTTFIVTFVSNSTLENGSRIISGIRNGKCNLGYSVLTDTSRVKATGRRHKFLASAIESLKKYI